MANPGSDHEQHSRISNGPAAGTDLTTDGAISLFTSALNSALEKQKATLIEHFETRIEKSKKVTGVDASDFTFKCEGNKIQHSFNSERLEKLSSIFCHNISINKCLANSFT
jgi:hypothetical protein